MTAETCANCGRDIGRLETPRVWDGNIVCGPCDTLLRGDAVLAIKENRPAPAPIPANPFPPPHPGGPTIAMSTAPACPYCGSHSIASSRMIHERGTRTTTGFGVVGDNLAVMGGTSKTINATRHAPPTERSLILPILGVLFFSVALLVSASVSIGAYRSQNWREQDSAATYMGLSIFFLLGAAGSVWAAIAMNRWNRGEYVALYSAWTKTWGCDACGRSFYESARVLPGVILPQGNLPSGGSPRRALP